MKKLKDLEGADPGVDLDKILESNAKLLEDILRDLEDLENSEDDEDGEDGEDDEGPQRLPFNIMILLLPSGIN
jgi:hypothetical protein